MTDELQPEPEAAPKARAPRKPRAAKPKAAETAGEEPKAAKKSAKRSAAAKSGGEKPKKAAPRKRKAKPEEAAEVAPPGTAAAEMAVTTIFAFDDPIGDTTDGEARFVTEPLPEADAEIPAAAAETEDELPEADVGVEIEVEVEETASFAAIEGESEEEEEEEEPAEPLPAPNLERLQKILSQAGIASRRRAEEMIVEGRVAVNGQVVTALGSKADPARDHIRVDGKLLHGAERHRYFMLNKPRGYVTTVSDPEGRPTVMNFVSHLRERLYPVGRLDFQSEGLLLLTNDGELANALTRAASGVEKTYLVKVAGQPSEEDLDKLRGGVSIETAKPGSAKVRTAPAQVRQVRAGDNPWYEVVLIEGRNRELRKMFSAIGHFVEKIRRVGYGPLVLDVEPGQVRELAAEEVANLRLAAEGKLKPRRVKATRMLPREAGQSAEQREAGSRQARARAGGPATRGQRPFRPKPGAPPKREWKPRGEGFGGGGASGGTSSGTSRGAGREFGRESGREFRPGAGRGPTSGGGREFGRGDFGRGERKEFGRSKGAGEGFAGRGEGRPPGRSKPFGAGFAGGREPREFGRARPAREGFPGRGESRSEGPKGKPFGGPAKRWGERPERRPFRGEAGAAPPRFREKSPRPFGGRSESSADRPKRTFGAKPGGFSRPPGTGRPPGKSRPPGRRTGPPRPPGRGGRG